MTSLFVILIFVIYFLPTIIGYKHKNFNSIFILNLLLGWTLIGWVVAIVWAVSHEEPIKKEVPQKKCPKCAEFVKAEALMCRFCNYEFITENELFVDDNPSADMIDEEESEKIRRNLNNGIFN